MPKAIAAIPRSNTSHQLSAIVRNSARPAKGGLESMCVLVIGQLPQLEPICFGLRLCSGAGLRSVGSFAPFLNRTPTRNDAIVHLEKLKRSVGVAVPLMEAGTSASIFLTAAPISGRSSYTKARDASI